MLARVKQDYAAGPVMAFSGREYVRSEWREVPAGFEEQARNHPLLDTQPSLDEVRAGGTLAKGEPPITVETAEPPTESQPEEPPVEEAPAELPAEEPPAEEPKTPRRRRRAAED